MTKQEALFKYLLRLGDTNLILSQRLSEWCGTGPFLEEDLAMTNIALDLIGTAEAEFTYAAAIEGKGRSADDLTFLRPEREFTNVLLVEQPNIDFGATTLRQFFVDVFDYFHYTELAKSSDQTIAGIAAKALKEATYHVRHSESWVIRLGDGTEESHLRMQNALNELWRFTEELFEMNEVDAMLIEERIAVDLTPIKAKWQEKVESVLREATLAIPENTFMQRGGREGKHSEHFGFLIAEMQFLPRAYPDATW
jgi:ring-1,2-phenylacetyl-CoA epoxidase subunit PaaC